LIGTYRIIDGNHRCIAFQQLGILKHGCIVICPVSKTDEKLSSTQVQVLQQGYNFINSAGTFRSSVLEMILTLKKTLPNFIKRKKGTEVINLTNVCYLISNFFSLFMILKNWQ